MAAIASSSTRVLGSLSLPVIQAPMFLLSNPNLVVATCESGVVGTFPALNSRTTEGYEGWLNDIKSRLDASTSPSLTKMYGVNLIVHSSNPRLKADLEVTVKHKVPLVITSLGAVSDVVDAVHSYGGLVFHDVITTRHAKSAAKAGVDGLILVCAGAGGHGGLLNPFVFVPEVRSFFSKTIILAGAMSTGACVASAQALGADYAYLGTRFINTTEAGGSQEMKDMIVSSSSADIMYTAAFSGVSANFLRPSIVKAGINPDDLKEKKEINFGKELDAAKAWKDIWSAGQGVGTINDILPTKDLVARLKSEYNQAVSQLSRLAGQNLGEKPQSKL